MIVSHNSANYRANPDSKLINLIELSEGNMSHLVELTAHDHLRTRVAFNQYDRCRESLQISTRRKHSVDQSAKMAGTLISASILAYKGWQWLNSRAETRVISAQVGQVVAAILSEHSNRSGLRAHRHLNSSALLSAIPEYLMRAGFVKCASILLGCTAIGSKLMNVSHKYSESLRDRAYAQVQTARFHSQAHSDLMNSEHAHQMSLMKAATRSLDNAHQRIREIWRSIRAVQRSK